MDNAALTAAAALADILTADLARPYRLAEVLKAVASVASRHRAALDGRRRKRPTLRQLNSRRLLFLVVVLRLRLVATAPQIDATQAIKPYSPFMLPLTTSFLTAGRLGTRPDADDPWRSVAPFLATLAAILAFPALRVLPQL